MSTNGTARMGCIVASSFDQTSGLQLKPTMLAKTRGTVGSTKNVKWRLNLYLMPKNRIQSRRPALNSFVVNWRVIKQKKSVI